MNQLPKYSDVEETVSAVGGSRHALTREIESIIRGHRSNILPYGTLEIYFSAYGVKDLENRIFNMKNVPKPVCPCKNTRTSETMTDQGRTVVPFSNVCPDIIRMLDQNPDIELRFLVDHIDNVFCQVKLKDREEWGNVETVCTKNAYCQML